MLYICKRKSVIMDKLGEIFIHIVGQVGNEPLGPDNYDISNLKQMIDDVEDLLYPNEKSTSRPIISYEMQPGSVKHVFKTQMQKVAEFGAVLSMVVANGNLDGLESKTAHAFEHIQTLARQYGYNINFSTSVNDKTLLKLNPETNYIRTEQVWADAEFYFYGKVTDAGGKNKANIHLDTQNYGPLLINVDKDYLESFEGNPLYRDFGVRASGKQNVVTGELDTSSLKLIEIINYERKFNAKYIDNLIKKATPRFKDLDVDSWVAEIRGDDNYV